MSYGLTEALPRLPEQWPQSWVDFSEGLRDYLRCAPIWLDMDALFLGSFQRILFEAESGWVSRPHPDSSWTWLECTWSGKMPWSVLLWSFCPRSSSHPSSWMPSMGNISRPWRPWCKPGPLLPASGGPHWPASCGAPTSSAGSTWCPTYPEGSFQVSQIQVAW